MSDVSDIKESLRLKGYKMTKQREAILDAFLACTEHLLTAHQLFRQVMIKVPQTNFSTVYRNLEILVQEGIVNKVPVQDKTLAYELNIKAGHHHHLICKICGGVQCIDYCPIDNISERHGFKHTGHRLEIYGFCRECLTLQTT